MEEGTPFCPHCNAPQIRVVVEGGEQTVTYETATRVLSASKRLEWPHALPAAATSGAISAVLMLFPFAGLTLGTIFGGMLCVMLYRRRAPRAPLTTGMGAKLGAISGILAFAFFSIFTAVEVLVLHAGEQLRVELLKQVNEAASRNTEAQMQPVFDYLRTSAGMQFAMMVGFASIFLIFLVLSSAGGALGTALLRRRRPR